MAFSAKLELEIMPSCVQTFNLTVADYMTETFSTPQHPRGTYHSIWDLLRLNCFS